MYRNMRRNKYKNKYKSTYKNTWKISMKMSMEISMEISMKISMETESLQIVTERYRMLQQEVKDSPKEKIQCKNTLENNREKG